MATRPKKTTTDEAKATAEEEAAAKAKAEADAAAKAKAEEEAAAKAAAEAATKAKAGGKVQVIALQTIRCDGKTYKAGAKVPVTEEHAEQLVAAHVAQR